jgi:hypothetical protein
MARWRDGERARGRDGERARGRDEMRCDEADATDFFPFSSLLFSSSSCRVLLSLDHLIYTLSILTSFTTISLHLLLPPDDHPRTRTLAPRYICPPFLL